MTEPIILAIDTSCDETSAAVTTGRQVLSNVISSQINLHKKYGGVYPALAKRAHLERIDHVIAEALKRARANLNHQEPAAVAVTYGPGLAIALEVGLAKAKELSANYRLPLIAVNHMEGHIYSCLAQNRSGRPQREVIFPALCLLVSGGHTELVLMKDHGRYQVLGETLDDAVGEALDKAARILRLGYPGGPIIERLTEQALPSSKFKVQSFDKAQDKSVKFLLTPPLRERGNLNFSYSGLKTQFLYLVQKMSETELGQNLADLAAAFQEAAFEQLIRKTSDAIEIHQPKTLLCGGGVIANRYLRTLLRRLAKENQLPVFFPPAKNLIGDNAAMIGVAAGYKFQRKEFVENLETLDREPRLSL
ncbi:MAG TPA: tRNA (adenosine(37)-N6)-threonylcarbamoyltransferase complex transferase subunit TsaD [Patescibacteria group bacterium]|nr:tRNA (adenosine(37)-N6)-threonylcarbamoyltransferase complex transferase subunit TsaD [Patescibacteria group bacterium]